jgi:18S rRNA (guanine1575-N7)-methyltransferase
MFFFQSLYTGLRRGGRAVMQFYPESSKQVEMITTTALRCGFKGGVVIDFPNSSKAKKYFLCLHTGGGDYGESGEYKPMGLVHEHEKAAGGKAFGVEFTATKTHKGGKKGRRPDMKHNVKSKEWIKGKKEKCQLQGRKTKDDSKFTGRKRSNTRGF